jgi:hypothetical protein
VISRRRFLTVGAISVVGVAAGGFGAVEAGWLPGRVALGTALGRCGLDTEVPDEPPGPVRGKGFASSYRNREVTMQFAVPPGVASGGLPVALVLHGRGGDARTAFDDLHYDRFLAAYVKGGGAPFALATADGGTGYWHPRKDGDDPLGMLVNEVLPCLADGGFAVDRIGVTGWSMGGYGALLMARESARGNLGGATVVAAAAGSPALFGSYGDAADGAFEDAADFAEWGTLIDDPGVDPHTALRVECGDTDAFTGATRDYRDAVERTPAGGITRGCHDVSYWRSIAAAQIAFLGEHLAS